MYELKSQRGTELTYDSKDVYEYRDGKKYALKQLGEYAAVYPLHVSSKEPNGGDAEENDPPYHPHDATEFYCDFFKKGSYLYSLRRDNYYPSKECMIEFYKNKYGKVVFIFNKKHGAIDVCDADNGTTLHTDDRSDKFVQGYKRLGDAYLFFEGWYWSPVYYSALYEVDKLINEENYEPVVIEWEGEYSPGFVPTETGMLKSQYIDREFSPKQVMDNHESIAKECQRLHRVKFFNEHRSKDNFLRVILNLSSEHISFESDAKKRLEDLLNADVDSLNITVTEKVSGSDSTSTYDDNLIRGITFSDERKVIGSWRETITREDGLRYLTPKILLPFDMFGGYVDGYVRKISVDGFHLRFRFDYVLKGADPSSVTVEIDQDLTKEEDGEGYKVSDDLPCKIMVL
ncbi:uncharacterized protein SPPG_03443 [Spizellomyces punctatus DAOM BR117]|uniref:Uncharacterized protein n=1 Tax=Spizellomyces punctatus (strain DAOM BR117) TaxID=645134 RepID=A0A0L0HJL0_SPIPD|nr:uncharacterized protein SPPG_03443 [Spizellomyces punctatus DAOM BR117]KND01646.1 hypothetical protein SPPG_03443 [Spizellomyces punctatus DAOM BR117]|eukprot:XP_016609685.1 hypothetical protein SPPG_03443 [Spizellomyces punctatus DAOM BR117]